MMVNFIKNPLFMILFSKREGLTIEEVVNLDMSYDDSGYLEQQSSDIQLVLIDVKECIFGDFNSNHIQLCLLGLIDTMKMSENNMHHNEIEDYIDELYVEVYEHMTDNEQCLADHGQYFGLGHHVDRIIWKMCSQKL